MNLAKILRVNSGELKEAENEAPQAPRTETPQVSRGTGNPFPADLEVCRSVVSTPSGIRERRTWNNWSNLVEE